MATTTNVVQPTDPLTNPIVGDIRWVGNVTYSFTDSATDYENPYSAENEPASFQAFSGIQQTAAKAAINIISSVVNPANLSFTEIVGAGDSTADMRMALSSAPPTAQAYTPGIQSGGDVWFNKTDYNNPALSNYAFVTFIHEIGHAVGLDHPHENNMPANRDSVEFSVMTYRSFIGDDVTGYNNGEFDYPTSLMMYDIAALQYMYGANFTTNAGNTVYSWSPTTGQSFINGAGQTVPGDNRIFLTIWDGGGVDTYNFSNYATNLNINLAPGSWSVTDAAQLANLSGDGTKMAVGNVFNALQFNGDVRSLIENAIGGSGNDTLRGNEAGNTLTGNNGNDLLYGLGGNDSLLGNLGNDYMEGGAGNDTYSVDNSADVVLEGLNQGFDQVYSLSHYTLGANLEVLQLVGTNINGAGNNADNGIYGTAGINNLQGNGGNDQLFGFAGDDVLIGGTGNDTMTGGQGNDTYFVDSALDVVIELAGGAEGANDTIQSIVTFWLSANVETLRLTGNINGNGNNAFNWIFGDAGANGIRGYGSADFMSGGGGLDTFVLAKGETQGDVITDFDGLGAGNGDRLLLSGWGAGATVTFLGGNNWLINSTLGNEYFSLSNGYTLHASDFTFI